MGLVVGGLQGGLGRLGLRGAGLSQCGLSQVGLNPALQPGSCGAIVPIHRRFGNLEKFGGFRNAETRKRDAIDNLHLAGTHLLQFGDRGIQGEKFHIGKIGSGGDEFHRHESGAFSITSLPGVPATCGVDENLAHGAGDDRLEVRRRDAGELRRILELYPRLVDESRGVEGKARFPTADGRRNAAQFLVGKTERIVDQAPGRAIYRRGTRCRCFSRIGHDGFSGRFAQLSIKALHAEYGDAKLIKAVTALWHGRILSRPPSGGALNFGN